MMDIHMLHPTHFLLETWQFAIEAMAIVFVDLPNLKMVVFHSYVSSTFPITMDPSDFCLWNDTL